MIHDDPAAFRTALAPGAPLLGLDLGTRTIGLALSDTRLGIATPVETLKRTKFTRDAEALEARIAARQVAGLVIGLPLNMDGSAGPRAQSARAFARNMAARGAPPLILWDERLSTVAAERALLEADTSRARRALVIDHVAAALILQGFLDRLAWMEREGT